MEGLKARLLRIAICTLSAWGSVAVFSTGAGPLRRWLQLLLLALVVAASLSLGVLMFAADPVDTALMSWFLRQPAWVRVPVGKVMVALGLAP